MRVVIIEDEPRAANRLERIIKEVSPELEVVQKLESVKSSLAYFENNTLPDLIFSDIQLTDDLSFEIYKKAKIDTPIIFTTAYDNYAISAFKTNGIDYLLKPISKEDVENALEKFKRLNTQEKKVDLDNIAALAAMLQERSISSNVQYKKRFAVKVGQHLKSIDIADVLAFYSKEKSTFLFTKQQRSYTIDHSLDQLVPVLDPELYFRINRNFIVHLKAADDIVSYSNSRLKLEIAGLNEELIIVARERTREFKKWLGE